MKLTKIFALALAAITMTACSDDDDDFSYNTLSGVTVEMAESNVEVVESQGLFSVPIVVNGDRNGYVRVTIECTETGTDPAIANRHYLLTSDVINIPADQTTGQVEFKTVDMRGDDPNRTFNVTIIKVEGGAVGSRPTTTVQIDEKGPAPVIAALPGTWFMSGNRYNPSTRKIDLPYEAEVKMVLVSQEADGSGVLRISPVADQFVMDLNYRYYSDEKYGEFVLPDGTTAFPGGQDIRWTYSGPEIVGKWNATYTAVTFGTTDTQLNAEEFVNDKGTGGLYEIISGFTLVKLAE